MRLKEDTSSWRSNAIIKRDFKHGNVPLPERSHTKSHKDTRRWCRGKTGLPHKVTYKHEKFLWYHHWSGSCENCGKKFYKTHQPKIDKPQAS